MMVLCEPKHVGAAFILLTILISKDFIICVHKLDNKVFENKGLFSELFSNVRQIVYSVGYACSYYVVLTNKNFNPFLLDT